MDKDSTENFQLHEYLNTNNTENFVMEKSQSPTLSCILSSNFPHRQPWKQLLLPFPLLSSSGSCLYNSTNHVTINTT